MANLAAALKGWPKEIREIKYRSAADDTDQPALHFAPKAKEARPLLVGLHSWSSDYRQANTSYGLWVVKQGWHFIHPNFRGRNRTPQAMGSELAVQDILIAVAWARKQGNVDARRIYVIGASGGGYASLLMAGRAPEMWAGVSAWVPISDLVKWHAETSKRKLRYAGEIEAALGGKPLPEGGTTAASYEGAANRFTSAAYRRPLASEADPWLDPSWLYTEPNFEQARLARLFASGLAWLDDSIGTVLDAV